MQNGDRVPWSPALPGGGGTGTERLQELRGVPAAHVRPKAAARGGSRACHEAGADAWKPGVNGGGGRQLLLYPVLQ